LALIDLVIPYYLFRRIITSPASRRRGSIQGIPASGNKIELSGIAVVRIENGKVVEEREESDMLGLMQQLGRELKPKAE
jgi:predicted ester cyclase